MGRVISSMSMSLDGFITAPQGTREHPLGEGGEELHAWLREGRSRRDARVLEELTRDTGAVVMGRRSYDLCEGEGGWGESGDGGPLGRVPCFVLTHSCPPLADAAPVFTFVSDGVESAVAQAQAAAGDRYVGVHGGTATQQCLSAGLLDEIQIHLVPVLLGGGVRLFDHLGTRKVALERIRVIESSAVTHLRFRVVR